jgi:F0F1-type ATP synthase assembly protein I
MLLWIDSRLGTGPWFLIAGVFLGFALSLRSMIKKLPSGRRDAMRGGGDSEPRSPSDPR